MTGLPQNVDDLLARLADNSRGELDLVRSLSDAIRRVDEQLLREVRTATVQHEARRGAILDELQTLAARLCCLPSRTGQAAERAAIEQPSRPDKHHAVDLVRGGGGGADWRQAAQNIQDELEGIFDTPAPRH